jgi:dTDP-4-dehydrorhamnose 3,5-epimerase
MQIRSLAITDVKIITPKKFGDDRGYFSETYNKQALAEAGIEETFVQDNQS